jgi:hypothetical protein
MLAATRNDIVDIDGGMQAVPGSVDLYFNYGFAKPGIRLSGFRSSKRHQTGQQIETVRQNAHPSRRSC